MFLLNPKQYKRFHPDAQSQAMVEKTISFFEQKGLAALKKDDQTSTWHEDFFQFLREEKILARLLTPAGYGEKNSRWDMWRISEFNEILGFYGLSYWYAWQCTILGLGPIWMSDNEDAKHKAAAALLDGGLFSFGLSEKTHGADIYSTDMIVRKDEAGSWLASGSKYYIGNGNKAAMVSTFGKWDKTGDYVFFVSRPGQPGYDVKKKIATSGVRPAFVAEFALQDYRLQDKDILHSGEQAWNAALNTVNIGKFELGFASVGIATHAFYEAIDHAANRELYKRKVTDFPHVRKLFTEAYARLVAMKLYGLRASDYMRVASPEDRRYLLFNPIMKMKVTSQGEKVVGLLHDVIAAKGFEQDTYFEMAIRDIGMLPKLEGTTHVNMALIIKFIRNYFFGHVAYPEVPQKSEAVDDAYLFRQNSGGLADIRFGDFRQAFADETSSNVLLFQKQIDLFKRLIMEAPPTEAQQKNVDFMLANGELFTLIAYSQLILENARLYTTGAALKNQIFGFLIRDFSEYALKMILNHSIEPAQETLYQQMIMKADADPAGFDQVWTQEVLPLKDAYRMNP